MTAAEGTGYEIAPWNLRWRGLDLDALHKTESTFALSNGHIGLRGTFEEGEPRGLPGTYLNGFYEQRALPYAEAGYGYPEDGQTVVNVTDGSIIRLLVDDEPLDMRYGEAIAHDRTLDFRSGSLRRVTEWESPTGRRVRVTSERFVSFTSRAIVAVRYCVEPLDGELEVVLQSDLLANEPIDSRSSDPRVAAALENPLVGEFAVADEYRAVLGHHTRSSGLRMAAGMDHELDLPSDARCRIEADGDLARLTIAADIPDGQSVTVTKFLAYGWSSRRSAPALRAQVDAALAEAMQTGWDTLLRRQREYLDHFWSVADIEIDGDDELQRAVRFALFHLIQAGSRGETRAIPAKGLTGPGYDGHAFWDTEIFVLPVLTYTTPDSARDALRWRHSTLARAKARATTLGQRGAAFPWRSINGDECSSYWPAGTAAFHVNADIANAVSRYIDVTGDTQFAEDYGLELLVETARLWESLGHFNSHGSFRIDGVTGPDEYSAVVDNNIYTNVMAQKNFRDAAALSSRHSAVADRLEVTADEIQRWRDAADHMAVPFDEKLGVHAQSENFTHHAPWDFDATPAENYPLLLNYPYFDLYRKQVVKQADLVLAMYLRGDAFTDEQKVANFAYYEALTVRDSSLSAAVQAVMAVEVGQMDLAYEYFAESALTDVKDLHSNVENGLHIASLAGSWIACVAGFGGMRDHSGDVSFAPRLPSQLDRIAFRLRIRGCTLCVEVLPDRAVYTLVEGEELDIVHHGEPSTITATVPVTLNIAARRPVDRVSQPTHRQPLSREAFGTPPAGARGSESSPP